MDLIIKTPGLQHIAETIFLNLSHKRLVYCRRVCLSWKELLLNNPIFWLKKCCFFKKNRLKWLKLIQYYSANEIIKIMITKYLKKIHKKVFEDSYYSKYNIGNHPLAIAYKCKDWTFLKHILTTMNDKAKINQEIAKRIKIAVFYQKYKTLKALAPFSEDTNGPEYAETDRNSEFFGWTLIQRAAHNNGINTKVGFDEPDYTKIVQILAPFAKKPNAPAPNGLTPIQLATSQRCVEIVKILAPISEAPNAPFPSTYMRSGIRITPIQIATALSFEGYSEIVVALAQFTDKPNAPLEGSTILQANIYRAVVANSDSQRKEAMKVIRVMAPLVDNPNASDPEGKTLLEIAKEENNEECYNEIAKILNECSKSKISRILNRLRRKRLKKSSIYEHDDYNPSKKSRYG